MRAVATISSVGQRLRHLGQRNMDGDGNGAQLGAGKHHHRHASTPVCRAARCARYSVWPGKPEAGIVERLLGDRAGDDRGGVAGKTVGDGAVDRFDDAGCIGRVRPAGTVDEGRRKRHHGQGAGEDCRALAPASFPRSALISAEAASPGRRSSAGSARR